MTPQPLNSPQPLWEPAAPGVPLRAFTPAATVRPRDRRVPRSPGTVRCWGCVHVPAFPPEACAGEVTKGRSAPVLVLNVGDTPVHPAARGVDHVDPRAVEHHHPFVAFRMCCPWLRSLGGAGERRGVAGGVAIVGGCRAHDVPFPVVVASVRGAVSARIQRCTTGRTVKGPPRAGRSAPLIRVDVHRYASMKRRTGDGCNGVERPGMGGRATRRQRSGRGHRVQGGPFTVVEQVQSNRRAAPTGCWFTVCG
jgi:hypothetical protein